MSSTGGWSVQGPPGPTFSTSNTNTGNTNSGIVGGTGNSIVTTNNAGILAGTSNTITTTATNAVIGGGTLNTITTATDASILGGGRNTIATGANYSIIGGGNSCSIGANAEYAVICGGASNQVNAARGFAGAGTLNIVGSGGTGSGIVCGLSNSTSGSLNTIIGSGSNNAIASGSTAAGILCGIGGNATMQTQNVHSGGYTVSVGERQRYELVLRGDTAGAAPAETAILKFGVAAGVPTQEITLVNGKTYTVRAIVNVTKTSDVTVYGGFFIDAIAKCTGGTVTVDGNNTTQLPAALPGGLLGATCAFSGTGTTLRLTGTIAGGLTTASKWTADVVVVETLA